MSLFMHRRLSPLLLIAVLGLGFSARRLAAAPPSSQTTTNPSARDDPAGDSPAARPHGGVRANLLAEPAALTFAPGATLGYESATIRLRNQSDFGRDIESIRISGSDWMGFEIVDEVLPDRILRDADVTIRVRVRPNHFVDDDGDRFAAENYRRLREGLATLDVVVDGHSLRVPLHFQPAPRRGLSPAAYASVIAGLLLFVAAALGLVRRERIHAAGRGDALPWRRRPTSLELVALLVLALLPFAPAALDAAAHDMTSLARASAGLGGTRAHLDPTGLGAALLLGAWTWICLHVARKGATSLPAMLSNARSHRALADARTPAMLAWMGLALTTVAAGTMASTADLGRIVIAQADVIPVSLVEIVPASLRGAPRVPAWFGLSAPWLGLLSIATAVWVCRATRLASVSGRVPPAAGAGAVTNTGGHPTSPSSERDRALVDLAAGATLVTLVWGGPLPAVGATPSAILVWGVASLVLKTLVLVGIARGLLRLRDPA